MRTCTGDGSSTVGQWNGTAPVCPVQYHSYLMYIIVIRLWEHGMRCKIKCHFPTV